MSNIIDKIQVSGVTYDIGGTGGGGNPTVELTQAEYDALVTAGTVSADTYYIITDAQAGDLTNYYTKTETNTLLGGKADTATTYTKTEVDTALGGKADTATTYTKTEVDNAITAATSTKQDTLVSGTNIKTINNTSILGSGNIDIQGGGGGGTTYTAGTNIDITNNIISCTLNASNGNGDYSFKEGYGTYAQKRCSHAEGEQTSAAAAYSHAEGAYTIANGNYSHTEGYNTKTYNNYEHASGQFNNSVSASTTFGDSGNTLFSVGNGTANNARHNAFEIRQNGDIYLSSGGTDIKLQDHLGSGGGGGVNVVQTTGTSTTDVMSQDAVTTQLNGKGDAIGIDMVSAPQKKVTFQMKRGGSYGTTISSRDLTLGRGLVYGEEGFDTLSTSGLVETSTITTSISSSSTDSQIPSAKAVNDKLGGLSLVKLTQSAYDALSPNYDSNTLYVIVN